MLNDIREHVTLVQLMDITVNVNQAVSITECCICD